MSEKPISWLYGILFFFFLVSGRFRFGTAVFGLVQVSVWNRKFRFLRQVKPALNLRTYSSRSVQFRFRF